jgi:CrcB protein
MRLFVMIGLCGGYTTFSSFSLQTLELLRSGAIVRAMLNAVLSVVLCVGAVTIGHLVASQLNGGVKAIAQIAVEEDA